MATYASLSPEDVAVLQNGINLIRASGGETCRVFNHLIAIANDTNMQNIFLSLDPTETIPNTSGLAGADDMTRQELIAFYNLLNTMRTTTDTTAFRNQATKAAGINATMG